MPHNVNIVRGLLRLRGLRGWWRRRLQHLVDLRNPRNGYHGGYLDRSDAFLYANFALLAAFVEGEYPGYVDWGHDAEIAALRDEFLALHLWWTKGRRDEHDEWLRGPDDGQAQVRLEALEAKDTAMLHRLIDVRGALWT